VSQEEGLSEPDWKELFYSFEDQGCTPFIGAGAVADWLPIGSRLSTEMAKEYEYPLDDSDLLERVSQYVALQHGDMAPKKFVERKLKSINIPDFHKDEYRNSPHVVLAELKQPLYITTNYDEFMESALRSKGTIPISEFCRWNNFLKNDIDIRSVFEKKDYEPDKEKPLVFHLHGQISDSRSMVLTETDYLDFLINLSKEDILPHQISRALNSTSLLFVGYSLKDINFRFIFRSLMQLLGQGLGSGLHLPSIAVQLPAGFTPEKREKAIRYLDTYTNNMFKVRVYWGDANKFALELRTRWEKFKNAK
jgi:SIR2-like domain